MGEKRFSCTITGTPRPWTRPVDGKDLRTGKKRRYQTKEQRELKAMIRTVVGVALREWEIVNGERWPTDQGYELEVLCYRARKRTATPDWDNYGKLISDALNDITWDDDAQVVRSTVEKYDTREFPEGWDASERTEITIWPVTP